MNGNFNLKTLARLIHFCLYSCEDLTEPPSCPTEIEEKYSENDQCGMIKDKNGSFGECLYMLSDDEIETLFLACVFDVCASRGEEQQQVCEALDNLQDRCYEEDDFKNSIDWRNDDFCPCKLYL